MATDLDKALRAYRDAVAMRAFWENHGTHGDGQLEAARRREAAALRTVKKVAGNA